MTLPGLTHLIRACRSHGLPAKFSPTQAPATRMEAAVCGHPLDPQLAMLYQELNSAELGEFYLADLVDEENGFHAWNERVRLYDMEPFRSCIIFGGVSGLAYCYATVPALADELNLQPVVEINYNAAELSAVPLASNVNRFFDLYASYIDQTTAENAAALRKISPWNIPPHTFPWSMPELVAMDEPLMALVRAGRFEFLTNDHPDALEWLQRLQEVG